MRTGQDREKRMERSIDRIAEQSLLYDFYGQLLTQRQGYIVEMYTQENLSLAEISQELGISRQGVHDALKKGLGSLEKYEEKLGLVSRFLRTEEVIDKIDGKILAMIEEAEDGSVDRELIEELIEIKSIIDALDD